jgi:holliday junction DNA helicase RuvB
MQKNPLLQSEKTFEDAQDKALRPKRFADFTGQKIACDNLKVFVEAARMRTEALDHTILYGPPGLGKTTIAYIIASELGVGIRTTSGPLLTKAGDLAAILTSLEPRDVLFIDEIHRLNSAVEEILYPAMEDNKLDLIIGEGVGARTVQIDLRPFTLVGATTRMGLISNPLRDRFGIPLRLQFYSPTELAYVIKRAAGLLQLQINQEGLHEIAKRSRGTPRIAIRLLRRIRDFAQVEAAQIVGLELISRALEMLEVDEMGLDSADRRYLSFIADFYDGGPVGVETIAAGLSEQRDTLEEMIEPFLLQCGLLQRTARGRMLSDKAYQHLHLTPPKREAIIEQPSLLD